VRSFSCVRMSLLTGKNGPHTPFILHSHISVGRNIILQLRDRCHMLLLALRDSGKDGLSNKIKDAVLAATK
jgi:hypothetical protein